MYLSVECHVAFTGNTFYSVLDQCLFEIDERGYCL